MKKLKMLESKLPNTELLENICRRDFFAIVCTWLLIWFAMLEKMWYKL